MTDISTLFLTESADDYGNAKCAVAAFGDRYAYNDSFGWIAYTGTHWERSGAEASLLEQVMRMILTRRMLAGDQIAIKVANGQAASLTEQAIQKFNKGMYTNGRNCMAILRSLLYRKPEAFTDNPDHLNTISGVIDLQTGSLKPHDPADGFRYVVPVEYDPQADYSEWEAFLLDALHPREALLPYLKLALGYSITGRTDEEIMFYIYGPPRSGKGTLTETMLALLGTPLATEVDFGTVLDKRNPNDQNFDLAGLTAARFVTAAETKQHEALDYAKLNRVTGGNLVRAAFKGKDAFEYRPSYKIWLVSNFPPNVSAEDDAVWGRMKIVEFPNSHLGEAQDSRVKNRMKSPANLRGVLRWLVEGAMEWYAEVERGGRVTEPEEIKTTTERYRTLADVVAQWLKECVVKVPPIKDGVKRRDLPQHLRHYGFTTNAQVRQSFDVWCKENGQLAYGSKRLASSLRRHGFRPDETVTINGVTQHGVLNMELRPYNFAKSADELAPFVDMTFAPKPNPDDD